MIFTMFPKDLPLITRNRDAPCEAKDCVQYCVRRELLAEFLDTWSDTEFTDDTSGTLRDGRKLGWQKFPLVNGGVTMVNGWRMVVQWW